MHTQPNSTASITNDVQTAVTHHRVRCLHRTVAGRRCRVHLPPDSTSLYCPRHATLHTNSPDATDLTPELLGTLTEIESPEDTQRILSKLFVLLVQDRVSLKKASVLTYILQQLLRTLNTIEHRNQYDAEHEQVQIILDVPRPYRGPAVNLDAKSSQEPAPQSQAQPS